MEIIASPCFEVINDIKSLSISLGSLSSDVKAVGLDGVAPSTVTVKDGSYKLQRPFKIAYIDTKLQILIKMPLKI